MVDFFSATLRYAVQLLTPAAIQVTKYSWIIYMPRWMNMICWYYLLNLKLIHLQAKICGRSNIVKDDIRWYLLFSLKINWPFHKKKSISFSGTWLSCSWTPRAVQRCCGRTVPSTCCDPAQSYFPMKTSSLPNLSPEMSAIINTATKNLCLVTLLKLQGYKWLLCMRHHIQVSDMAEDIMFNMHLCIISWWSWDQDQHYVLHYSSE